MRFVKRIWPLLGGILLTSCHEPSNEDIGRMVLVSAPLWFLMGWLALGLLLNLWRPVMDERRDELRVSWRPSQLAGLILILAALFGAASMTPAGWDFFLVGVPAENHRSGPYWPALLVLGLGYVTVALVTWRIWFALRKGPSFTWALISVLALYWLPALTLALERVVTDIGRQIVWGYLYATVPGYFGIPTALVFLGLVVEALRTRRRARDSSTALKAISTTSRT